jgi:hypothetical protein
MMMMMMMHDDHHDQDDDDDDDFGHCHISKRERRSSRHMADRDDCEVTVTLICHLARGSVWGSGSSSNRVSITGSWSQESRMPYATDTTKRPDE